jgi:hypothetical protein
MNNKIYLLATIIVAGLILHSCNKENDPAKPVINLLELGEGDSHGNDHTAKVGGELHIEADITAEGTIDKVNVLIHPEGDHEKLGISEEWELDTTYTKFSGLKNTLFHEHVEIDSTAEPGDYHFDLIVTDQEGFQTSVEAELKIVEE